MKLMRHMPLAETDYACTLLVSWLRICGVTRNVPVSLSPDAPVELSDVRDRATDRDAACAVWRLSTRTDSGRYAFLKTVPRLYELRIASATQLTKRCRLILRWFEGDADMNPRKLVLLPSQFYGLGLLCICAGRWRDAVKLFSLSLSLSLSRSLSLSLSLARAPHRNLRVCRRGNQVGYLRIAAADPTDGSGCQSPGAFRATAEIFIATGVCHLALGNYRSAARILAQTIAVCKRIGACGYGSPSSSPATALSPDAHTQHNLILLFFSFVFFRPPETDRDSPHISGR